MALFTHDTAIESRPKSASAVYVSRITRIFGMELLNLLFMLDIILL